MPPPNDVGYYPGGSFYTVLTAAINDLAAHGYDSAERVADWIRRIKEAAAASLTPSAVLDVALREALRSVYRREIDRGAILQRHPGVSRFTLQRVAPKLRAELDRRIMASAGLIKLDRERMIADTLDRLSGWATSIPAGGSDAVNRRALKERIRKPLASLPFQERRVIIDQSHKLVAAISETLAVDGGALAGHWVSHYTQRNYNYRPQHKHYDVDDKLFIVRGNWALTAGLIKPDGQRYVDEIERPGQLPFCRCYYRWIYNLRSLPADMLTVKGRAELERVKVAA